MWDEELQIVDYGKVLDYSIAEGLFQLYTENNGIFTSDPNITEKITILKIYYCGKF